jgi:DNA-binding NarL/FixJ family response regulator
MTLDDERASVLVVDDHEIVREGLTASLSGHPFRVTDAVGRGDEALRVIAEHPVDVAIVDLRLPDMSGHELIARIKGQRPETRVVVLSTYLSEETVRLSHEAGADAYVAKSSGISELRDTVTRLLTGEARQESPAETVKRLRGAGDGNGDAVLLTPQQERVLTLAAGGATDKEIATALFLSESTVRFHMQRLKEILGARSKTQVIAEALRRELIRSESW